MKFSKKLKKKIEDGSFREMWREAKWMFVYIRRYRLIVLIHILLGVLGTAMSLLSSLAMRQLIDVVTGFQTGGIWTAAAYMGGMLLGSAVMQSAASRIAAIINIRVQNGIQAEMYDRMLRTDWQSLKAFRSGDLINRLNSDVGTVANGVTGFLPSFVSGTVQFLGSLIIILCYDPVMALIALVGAPIYVLSSRALVRKMREYNKRMKDIGSQVMSFHEDSFRNIGTIKAFGIMDGFDGRMKQMQDTYRTAMLEYNLFSVIAGLVMSVIGLLISAGCFGWGVYRLWTHAISYGTMTMFLQLTNMLRSAFSTLIGLVPTAISITTSAGRLMAVVELPEEPFARETADIPDDFSIKLRNVSFSYNDGDKVLEHVEFDAHPGDMIALTGASGEGKTTIVYNLAQLFVKLGRRVLIIDCDLRNPTMYRMLGVDKCKGFFELVEGDAELAETVHAIIPNKLNIIFAGECDGDATDVLSQQRVGEMLGQLRQSYDYILIDTPPYSMLADAENMGEVIDGALMVVRQNYASRVSVVDAVTRLSEIDVPVVGYILNACVGGSLGQYGYGYGYGDKERR